MFKGSDQFYYDFLGFSYALGLQIPSKKVFIPLKPTKSTETEKVLGMKFSWIFYLSKVYIESFFIPLWRPTPLRLLLEPTKR